MAEALGSPELVRWAEGQARRERSAVRLEDALLGDRYPAYFAYRLRYFVVTTVIAAVVHAIRIVLLYGAFPREAFLWVVVAGAAAAVVSDAWWGGLERMRGRVRRLEHGGHGHLVPREIAGWLRLSTRLTAVGLVLVVPALVGVTASTGLAPAGVIVGTIVGGAAIGLTVRTYHSGAFAIRRIYRPMPSLIVMDVAGLAVLLLCYPFLGVWAFAVSELASLAIATGITLHYTGRTYRVLGFPTLRPLLRLPARLPSRAVLRSMLAPAAAYGLVGLDAILLLVVLEASTPGSATAVRTPMVALLAALSPVIRAGFDWARLLYFDLVRLGIPLLADLKLRFDRAVLALSGVVGLVAWAVAAGVAVVVLGIRDGVLLAVLVPFFVARSALAAAQMRSFAGGGFRRLAAVGIADLAAFGVALVVAPTATGRVLALALILAASAALLVALPPPEDEADALLARTDWLRSLRLASGPVRVTTVRFDGWSRARGVPDEARRTETWRRRGTGRRLARDARRAGGRATWLSELVLAWWVPASPSVSGGRRPSTARRATAQDLADPAAVVARAGGLVAAPPMAAEHRDGPAAALATGSRHLRIDPTIADPPLDALIAAFLRTFPDGIVHRAGHAAPPALARLPSRERAAAFRAGLRAARDLPVSHHDLAGFDVAPLVEDGRLRVLFLAPMTAPPALRRRWSRRVRARSVRSAMRG
ncbi:MAG: hypothetical protein U0869_19790 [Chloroflexota bacterium]